MIMKTMFEQTLASLATFVLFATAIQADDVVPEATPEKARPSRIELRDKQYDVSLDARDIERILTRLKRASELSKQRMTEAAEAAEGVAGAIERDPVAARARAEETAKMFQEISKLLEALLTEETPQKVAAARNIAAQLAKAEQQFAQQTQAMSKAMMQTPASASGQGTSDPKMPPNPNATKGQGGTPPQEPTEKPKSGANGRTARPEEPDGNTGGKGEKDTPAKDPQGTGEKPGEPMPKENPEGTGGKPDEDTDKEQPGQSGAGQKKADKDQEQPGAGSGNPDKKTPEENGSGGNGKKPEDQNPTERSSGGTGDAADDDMPAEKQPPGGGGRRTEKRPLTEEERREQLAGRADALAARAATLLDILDSIAKSEMPEDQTAAEKVSALLKETDLKNAVEAMQAAADQIRNQKLEDAQATALDVADRFQITTQRLDAVYRALVGPQAEELRKLEQQLVQLRTKLDELQTPAQVVAWHRAVSELLDNADELGISEKRREDLLNEMKQNGFSVGNTLNIANVQFADGRYVAPPIYNTKLVELQEEIQSRIQSLVLGEFASMTDDLAPPKYQGLVERYYQVLSKEGSPRSDAPSAGTDSPAKSKGKK